MEISKGVQDVLDRFDQQEKIKLKSAEVRNVIFVGRTRSGKSTCLKVLRAPSEVSPPGSLFSQTKDPMMHTFTVETEFKGSMHNFTINLFDTPGLFEIKVDDKDVRTDEVIKNTIAKCLDYEITKIHAIFFVCSFTAGVNKQDVLAFQQFMEFFEGGTDHVAMLITRTEKLPIQRKGLLLKDIQLHPELKPMMEKIGDRVFFFGALDEDLVDAGVYSTFKRASGNVVQMRESVYHWLFEKKGFVEISRVKYYQLQRDKFEKDFLPKFKVLFQKGFSTQKDSPEWKELRVQHDQLMKAMTPLLKFIDAKDSTEIAKTTKILGWDKPL